MEPNLLTYIWKNSKKEQTVALLIILASMPTYFLSLELPKQIVNGPIQGVGFDNPGDIATFMRITLPLPDFLYSGEPIVLFSGVDFERVGYLMALSISFLILVSANGIFKLIVNTFKGRMGERVLRRLRFQLFDRVLRFPLSRFRRTKASEVSSMIKDEVEPMGQFIGDAFAMPLFEGGQAATALIFIFLQDVYLGVLTIVMVSFQAWLIPRLRKPIIKLSKQRQVAARTLSGRLGEIVEGISDMHVNDTSNYERSNISSILNRLFFIRFELFKRNFSIKFLNNFLLQFLQFLFYALGGYFAIRGTLDIGQLVAVIAAFKDLPGPIRGLINWDQKRTLVEARYSQIVEQFASDSLLEPEKQTTTVEKVGKITKGFSISNLGVVDDTGSTLLERTSVEIGVNENVAVVGPVNAGATHFSQVLSRVILPTSGRVELDDTPLEDLPEYFTGRRVAFIDGNSYFPQGTILESLTYVLKHQPIIERMREGKAKTAHEDFLNEARLTRNSELDFDAEWIDYENIGIQDQDKLISRIREILVLIDLEEDIRGLGIRGSLDPKIYPEMCEQILQARQIFRSRLKVLGFDSFVEPFDPEKYNDQSTLGENLLFGTATTPSFQSDNLASNTLIREMLRKQGLEQSLFEMGKEVASTTVELFGDLSANNPFFDQLNYMQADDLPEYRAALARIGEGSLDGATKEDQELVLRLPFAYTETKNRLGLLNDELKDKIIETRKILRSALSELEHPPVAFFDPDHYNPAATVIDNILLGRVASNVAEGPERVFQAITDLMDELHLTDEIFRIGLDFNVGTGGKRLSESIRQKLHLARSLLKQPDILIINQALNTLDAKGQKKLLEAVLDKSRDSSHPFGIIWVPMNPALSQVFDRVLLFKDGELVADDTPAKLVNENELYKSLLAN
ncbi:MAG: ABC transporter ATP-binding protein [Hyphomicrobiales bacterium]|nr:ABC transporter ATP-binding protein [Hyphomicrobiales bacterium]